MIRVMICDDQDMIRIGLSAVLGSFDDIVIVGVAADGFSALRAGASGSLNKASGPEELANAVRSVVPARAIVRS